MVHIKYSGYILHSKLLVSIAFFYSLMICALYDVYMYIYKVNKDYYYMYYNLNLNRQSLVSSAVREFSYCLYHRHISHVDHMSKALHKSITCPYICYLTTNLFVFEFCTCGMTSGPIKIDQLITDNE